MSYVGTCTYLLPFDRLELAFYVFFFLEKFIHIRGIYSIKYISTVTLLDGECEHEYHPRDVASSNFG